MILDDHRHPSSERAPVACRRNHGPASHFTRSPWYRGARGAVFRPLFAHYTRATEPATGADRPKQGTRAPVIAMITITLPVPEKSLRPLSSRQLTSDRQCATVVVTAMRTRLRAAYRLAPIDAKVARARPHEIYGTYGIYGIYGASSVTFTGSSRPLRSIPS